MMSNFYIKIQLERKKLYVKKEETTLVDYICELNKREREREKDQMINDTQNDST